MGFAPSPCANLHLKQNGCRMSVEVPAIAAQVEPMTWVDHFQKLAGGLKDEGNLAMKAGQHAEADQRYSHFGTCSILWCQGGMGTNISSHCGVELLPKVIMFPNMVTCTHPDEAMHLI